MEKEKDIFEIRKNFSAIAIFLLVLLLLVDIVLRIYPDVTKAMRNDHISAVGHHHQFRDGSSYYIYTIFHNNGDVYQCWWDEKNWNQKKVTNYKGPYMPEVEQSE